MGWGVGGGGGWRSLYEAFFPIVVFCFFSYRSFCMFLSYGSETLVQLLIWKCSFFQTKQNKTKQNKQSRDHNLPQGPSCFTSTFLLFLQAATSKKHLLRYDCPSEPHNACPSLGHSFSCRHRQVTDPSSLETHAALFLQGLLMSHAPEEGEGKGKGGLGKVLSISL